MKIKKLLVIVLALMMVATYLPMNALKVEAKANVKSIKLNYSKYTLKNGKTLKLKATVKPSKYKKKVVWQSSKKKIASVSKKGVVKGLKNGTAVITAKVKGSKKKATCKITVAIPVTSVSLNKNSADLYIGQSEQLKASLLPANATVKTVNYSSSNSKIVKVSKSGVITGLAEGSALITATAKDGGRKATCNVTVKGELSDDLLTLSKVSMKDAGGQELIKDWGWHYDEYEKKYIYRIISDSPTNDILSVTPEHNDVKAVVKDSDSEDYNKMITFSYAGYEKKCYVSVISTRSAYSNCGISKISMKDANNNELVDNWYYVEDEDDVSGHTIVKLETTASEINNTLTITPEFGKAIVTLKDVNKGDCKKMAVISCGGRETKYYIALSESHSMFALSSVSMKNSAGDELISDWWIDNEIEEGESILYLGTFAKELNDSLSVSPKYKSVVASIQESDMNGYDKMLVLKYADSIKKYYIVLELPGDAFDILNVSMKDAGDREMVADWCTYEDYYCDEDTWDEYNMDVIQLQTIAQSVENLNVTPKYKEVSVHVETSDLLGFDKMLVLEYGENEKKYYVELNNSPDLFYFSNVSMKDSNGKELIDNWYYDCVYDGVEDAYYDILKLKTFAKELNDTLTLSPKYKDTSVTIKDSDKTEYKKMVEISCGGSTYKYYIELVVPDEPFEIADVSMKKDGKESILDWDWDEDYYEDDETDTEYWVNVLYLKTMETEIKDLVVTPKYKDARVTNITNSDISYYDKKLVLKYGEHEKTYYVKLELPYNIFGIENVSMKDSKGIEHVENWTVGEDYDDNTDDCYDVLRIETSATEINENLKITMDYKEVSAIVKDSDISAYKKMLVLTCAGSEQKYYIKLDLPNNALDIGNVSMKDATGSELVEKWGCFTEEWEDDDDWYEYTVLEIEMLSDKINDTLKIVPAYKNANAVIKNSDKTEFEKMVEISYGGNTEKYYIDIDTPDNLTGIRKVSMIDENGDDQIDWWYIGVNRDGNRKYNELRIDSYAPELTDEFTIMPKNKQSTATIMQSDNDGYEKMVVIKNGNIEKKYYIKLYVID